MKVKEILEMAKYEPVADIAKEHLKIGEKRVRRALKEAGCYSIVGKSGWIFNEEDYPVENLEKDIYYFDEQAKAAEEKERARLMKERRTIRKRHSFDLDQNLMKRLKIHAIEEDLLLYEAVEQAIELYLSNKKDHR